MVDAVEVARLFDGGDVGGLLDHADQFLIAGGTAAIDAGIDVGDVVADGAQAQLGLHVADGGGERLGVVRARRAEYETRGAARSCCRFRAAS